MQKKFLKQIVKILGPCEIEERGKWVPLSEDYINNKFDLDLDFGKVGEKYIEQGFEGDGRIEVKTERGDFSNPKSWVNTNNIAIEFECRGKPSGISTTEASHWAHVLEIHGEVQYTILLAVETLRGIIKSLGVSIERFTTNGGDDDAARMYLFPTSMFGIDTNLILDAYELNHNP